ncbi:MAG: DoxX family protein [Acidimicrobiia bacterium]|nr:DoxX family protein [Acidimicrobiia bacterium]MDH5289145.1 DoxX family protein [Acidimicrobiia bacterium]
MTRLEDRRSRFDEIDARVVAWMHRIGHRLDRLAIGLVFVWFGLLKVLGFKSATSVIAETVYLGSPEVTVRLLGLWELAIGVCLIAPGLARIGVALLAIRLPGTLLALALKAELCWTDTFPVPTIQGQYLIKDAILFFAAMIIGGTLRTTARERFD